MKKIIETACREDVSSSEKEALLLSVLEHEILFQKEAIVLLETTRPSFNGYLKKGLIKPLKKDGNNSIYLKSDILRVKEAVQRNKKYANDAYKK